MKKFTVPVRNVSVDTDLIVSEFSSYFMQYAVQLHSTIYLSIINPIDHRPVYWNIFHTSNASEWFNPLA